MTFLESVVVPLISGSFAAVVVALFVERRRVTWTAKREACLDALEIVNGIFANRPWTITGGESMAVSPQSPPSIAEVRRCHNALAITCRRTDVIEYYLKCVFEDNVGGDTIDDLRDAVRKECGLGWKRLDRDRARSFLGRIAGTAEAVK
jgi:hypothetical protein